MNFDFIELDKLYVSGIFSAFLQSTVRSSTSQHVLYGAIYKKADMNFDL